MNRRQWLQLTASAAPTLLAPAAFCAESRGKWSDESIAEWSQKLFDWLKADFASRADQLHQHGDRDFELKYDYLAPTEDRRQLRLLEKFQEGRLSRVATRKHIEASLKEFESVRQSLAAAEEKAAKSWTSKGATPEEKEGMIYDTSVSSGRLSVILDNSHSMTPYLKKLRAEISRDFPDAYFVEVDGCQLKRDPVAPWYFCKPIRGINPFTPDRHIPAVPVKDDLPCSTFIRWTRDTPGALHCMADLIQSDAIYWFCDFDDSDNESVVKAIARKLIEKKIKLFVHTVDKRPPSLISLLAEKSGGQVIKKRI